MTTKITPEELESAGVTLLNSVMPPTVEVATASAALAMGASRIRELEAEVDALGEAFVALLAVPQ